ncbi:uncharacterized protein LOC133824629 isoform X2 [Humulus lupulus]|uniref:uncharacterized protein LOC133824629 isoform X2 n=1 Tax=Humulus lupulus TaxID=3486 RepID=UPI002B41536D|nr:uncharacterized protein LOC133824629 isoform X2 [Humulus lupulus]
MDPLREDGSTRVCCVNDDCNEGSLSKRTNECIMECALMRCCHSDFRAENTAASTEEPSMQDISIQAGSELEQCEQSRFYLGIYKRMEELATDDVVGVVFESLEKAEAFYYVYSNVLGFSVRKDDVRRDKRGSIVLRRWVCSKEGQRRQKYIERADRRQRTRALTRIGCCAAFRVSYSKNKGIWIAKEFVPTHTHGVSSSNGALLQDSRWPTQVGTYVFREWEQSSFHLGIDKRMNELAKEDVVGVEFETLEKAEAFYYTYSNVVGFSVRRHDMKRDKDGSVVFRKWVCSKEGQRRQKHLERIDRKQRSRALTRVGCSAAFSVRCNKKTGKWVVREFVSNHTHPWEPIYMLSVTPPNQNVESGFVKEKDAVEGAGKGNPRSYQRNCSLREEVGSNQGCYHNNNSKEGSCGGRSNEFELECGDMTGWHGGSSEENITSNKDISMQSFHGTSVVENVKNNKDLSMQDLGMSTRAQSCCVERCEQSHFFCLDIDKRFEDLTTENMVGLEFHTLEKAEAFYYMYSTIIGFNVRKDDVKRDKHGLVYLRRWVCSKEGQRRQKHLERVDRKRKPKVLTRVGCCAAFRVNHDRKKGSWVIKEFVPTHTHLLAAAKELPSLKSNCNMEDLTQSKTMGNVEDGREGSTSSVQPTCDVSFLHDNVMNGREGSTSGAQPTCDVSFLQDIGREGSTSGVQPVCDKSFLQDNGREGSTSSGGQPTCDVSSLQDNVVDGREGSMSGVRPKSHAASFLQENVVDRREGRTSGGVQQRTCDVVPGITLPPWTLTMPKIDKGTQVIEIPCVNEVEGLPLPNDVKHVSAEIVTNLLQMVGGLHEVVMETILQAKDKLKEATEESQRKDLEIAELRNALEAYKHAAEYQGSKESNNDNPIEVRNFGGLINLNEANGEDRVVDKGGEVGRQGGHGSDYGCKTNYKQSNLMIKHILKDAEMSDRLPKKAKTNL